MLHQGVTTNKRTPSRFLLGDSVFSYHEQCSKIVNAVNQYSFCQIRFNQIDGL